MVVLERNRRHSCDKIFSGRQPRQSKDAATFRGLTLPLSSGFYCDVTFVFVGGNCVCTRGGLGGFVHNFLVLANIILLALSQKDSAL